jgi:hypothetical protein
MLSVDQTTQCQMLGSIGKDIDGIGYGLITETTMEFSWRAWGKPSEILGEDSRYPDQASSSGPIKYEARLLPIRYEV